VNRIVIAGGGGLGTEIGATIRLLEELGRAELIGLLDDSEKPDWAPHLGPITRDAVPEGCSVIIAVGDPRLRHEIWMRMDVDDLDFANVVHPSSVVSSGARIGAGTFVAPFAYLAPNVTVGKNVVVGPYASGGHDSTIGDHAAFSPYATLNGHAVVGTGVFLGAAAVVCSSVEVGEWSKISAGTIVNATCSPGSLVAGNPMRSRVMFRPPDRECR
jgi:sugar O-acyltransferase (sialic acid O-acetyltransferase NeuD family)